MRTDWAVGDSWADFLFYVAALETSAVCCKRILRHGGYGAKILSNIFCGLFVFFMKGPWILVVIGFLVRLLFFWNFGGWTTDVQPPGLSLEA